jgi:transposase
VENLTRNIKEARARLEVAMATKSAAWLQVMESSEEGYLQKIVGWRDEAEKAGTLAIKLEALIEIWEHKLAEVRTRPAPVKPKSTTYFTSNPSPWGESERERQQRVAGG